MVYTLQVVQGAAQLRGLDSVAELGEHRATSWLQEMMNSEHCLDDKGCAGGSHPARAWWFVIAGRQYGSSACWRHPRHHDNEDGLLDEVAANRWGLRSDT